MYENDEYYGMSEPSEADNLFDEIREKYMSMLSKSVQDELSTLRYRVNELEKEKK